MKKVALYFFIALIVVPFGIFFCSTYLSPIHATFILFADFVYDPEYADT
jgi:hypothetical protein